MLRIVGWNIRAGGGRRVDRIARAVAAWHADVVVLSEFRGTPPSRNLAALLRDQGLPFQRTTADPQSPALNALLIASAWPLQDTSPIATGPQEPARWLPVEVTSPEPFLLAGMHIPNRVSGRKYPFLTGALRQAELWKDGRAILMGDTNSGKPHIDEESPAFNHIEGGWIESLEELGWRDAYRQHAGHRRAYTWYSPNGNNGFRLDQAFLSPSVSALLRRATRRWGGGSRRAGVSDHAAVIVDL